MRPRMSRWGLVAAGLCALAVTTPARAEGPQLFRIGSIAPEGTSWTGNDCLGGAVKVLEQVAPGKLRVRPIYGASLGDEHSQIERVQKGKLEVYGGGLVALTRFVPELAALALPFLYESDEEVDAVLASPVADQARAIARAAGFEVIAFSEVGWRGFGGKRALRKVADFEGLAVRSSESAEQLEMWRLLGARPRPLPVTETLPALETHVVEGFDQTPVFMFGASWHQHAPYYVISHHLYEPAIFLAAKGKLQSIGLRNEAFKSVGPRCTAAVRAEGKTVLEELRRTGAQVITLTPEERRALADKVGGPVRAYFRKHTTAAGRKLLDSIERVLEQRRKGKR